MASYSWNNGLGVAQTYTTSTAGNYFVHLIDPYGCEGYSDTANVTIVPGPVPNLGPDINLSLGSFATLDPGTFSSYQWSTGEITPSIVVIANDLGPGTHTVSVDVRDDNGCIGSDHITITVVNEQGTGIAEQQSGPFRVFPNPTKASLNIALPQVTTAKLDVRIMSVTGQVVLATQLQAQGTDLLQLNVNALAPGTYFVQLELEGVKQLVPVWKQ